MDFLMVSTPKGLWAWLINSIESGVMSYALTIILVTLIIKCVLIPFDIFNKYSTKKNMQVQAKLKPELDNIKRRYANNPQIQNQKTMELYKRENYSMGGTCAIMLVYMVVTMVVFFTLLSTLNSMSAYKIQQQYDGLYNTYKVEYASQIEAGVSEEDAVKYAQEKVTEKYEETKEGFLWIKNIWRPDTSASVTLNYKDFSSIAKLSKVEKAGTSYEYDKLTEEQKKIVDELDTEEKKADYNKYTESTYNLVMGDLLSNSKYTKWNGYFILSILAALLTFGSLKITEVIAKVKAKKKGLPPVQSSNKTMSFVMPIIMAVFTLLYNSAFALYVVAGSLFGFVTGPLVSWIVDKMYDKFDSKKQVQNKSSYDRTLKK